jgi:hypothetical protein
MCRCMGSAKPAGWDGMAPARGPVTVIFVTTEYASFLMTERLASEHF